MVAAAVLYFLGMWGYMQAVWGVLEEGSVVVAEEKLLELIPC